MMRMRHTWVKKEDSTIIHKGTEGWTKGGNANARCFVLLLLLHLEEARSRGKRHVPKNSEIERESEGKGRCRWHSLRRLGGEGNRERGTQRWIGEIGRQREKQKAKWI
ncbi:hypothetical protein RIF29_15391 [Crotalaria pallida]|uniref:Uncharacterized protein n=1 Tax=Crotalaria pallida TaxID=3830 RepID=A0AAN9FLP8_CROPI